MEVMILAEMTLGLEVLCGKPKIVFAVCGMVPLYINDCAFIGKPVASS
jgi:hypothetical protein